MEIGRKIKKYRESINLSQEDLASKVYVSRQTVSNWENDKSYPDINSLKIMSTIFAISLDELIKEDIKELKKEINEDDIKKYNSLSTRYTLEFFIMLVSAYPLVRFSGIGGILIWVIITILTLHTGFKIEKIYKRNDCRTYKEIVAFIEGNTLSLKEQIEEKAKWPYQKFLLGLLSGIIAILIFIVLDLLFR